MNIQYECKKSSLKVELLLSTLTRLRCVNFVAFANDESMVSSLKSALNTAGQLLGIVFQCDIAKETLKGNK
jgi:hypothetical protein